jgi:predicted RNase H-like HicB family nuclease
MKSNHDEYRKKASMTLVNSRLTAIIAKKGRWYVGTIKELPGANSQGRTLAELRRNLKDAVQLIVEAAELT